MATARLTLDETVRIIAVAQKVFDKLGVSQEKLQSHMDEHEGEHILVVIMGIVKEVVDHAFGDWDFEKEEPGEVCMLVCGTLARLTGKTIEEVRNTEPEEAIQWIEELIATERDRRLGKYVGRMTQPITSLISKAIEIVKTKAEFAMLQFASFGGPSSGGMIGYSSDLEESSGSSQESLEPSSLETPLPSSEESASTEN